MGVALCGCRAHYRVNLRANPFKFKTEERGETEQGDGILMVKLTKKSAPEGRRSNQEAMRVEKSVSIMSVCCDNSTEPEIVGPWLGELYHCSCITVLPGPTWVLLSYVLHTLFAGPVC